MDQVFIIVGVFLGVLMTFAVHEWAHAWMAYSLGDPTAKYEGRLSLNPFVHLDPVGASVLGLSLLLTHGYAPIGWGKPVHFEEKNFKNPEIDTVLTVVVAPLANLFMAVLLGLPVAFGWFDQAPVLLAITQRLVYVNVAFAVFNCIPWPPLDGWKILMAVVPKGLYQKLYRLEQKAGVYSILGLILVLMVIGRWTFTPLVHSLGSLLMGGRGL